MIFQNISSSRAIFLALFFSLTGFLIFLFFGTITSAFLIGKWELSALTTFDSSTEEGLRVIRIMQMFQTIGLFIFPSVVMALLVGKSFNDFLGLKLAPANLFFLSVFMMLIVIPGINLLASLNSMLPAPEWMIEMEHSAELLIKKLLVTDNVGLLVVNLFMVAVLPAIGEEFFFRGVLQKYFIKLTGGVFLGVLITSFLFSAIHLQFLGFIPRLLLGMAFGYLYVWTGSIWAPIAAHFANNSLAVVVYYFIGKGVFSYDAENIGRVSDLWQLGVASLLFGAVLLWVIWKKRVKNLDSQAPVLTSEDP